MKKSDVEKVLAIAVNNGYVPTGSTIKASPTGSGRVSYSLELPNDAYVKLGIGPTAAIAAMNVVMWTSGNVQKVRV